MEGEEAQGGCGAKAQRAWAQLKHDKGGRVWMQHARHEDLGYLVAGGLARAGKNGRIECSETVC